MVSKATVRISWAASAWVKAWESASGVTPSAAARTSAAPVEAAGQDLIEQHPYRVGLADRRALLSSHPLPASSSPGLRSLLFAARAARGAGRLGPPARVLDVAAHSLGGGRAISFAQRGEDRLVLVGGLPPRGVPGRAGEQAGAGEGPQTVHQCEEERVAGGLVDDLVEGEVRAEKGFGVRRRAHLGDARGEPVAGFGVGGRRGGLGGAGLEQDADLEQFLQRVAVDVEDERQRARQRLGAQVGDEGAAAVAGATMPIASSARTASRIVGRETPSRSASTRSEGRRWPGSSVPRVISRLIWSTASAVTVRGVSARNPSCGVGSGRWQRRYPRESSRAIPSFAGV